MAAMLLWIYALMISQTTRSAQPETIKTVKGFLRLDAQDAISKIALHLPINDRLADVTITNPEQIKMIMNTLSQLTLTRREKTEYANHLEGWYLEFFGQDNKMKSYCFIHEKGIDRYSRIMSRLPMINYKIDNYEEFRVMAAKLLKLNPIAQ